MQELQIAKLEAEIEKIRADAANKLASSVENEADRDEKLAQAELKRAQARKLMSEADNLDMDFLKIDSGADHKEKLELEKLKHEANIEQMLIQAANNDRNIGVVR